MTDSDEDRLAFGRHLAVLAETFGETLTEPRIEGYFLALQDLELDAVRHAIETALRACKFFPRPVELRELAGDQAPDVGLIEACLVAHLRAHVGEYTAVPRDPFLRLVCERLGGAWTMGGMSSFDRLQALKAIVPALVVAARTRGIALPSFATPLDIAMANKGRHVALPAPDAPIGRDEARTILQQVWPKRRALPAPVGEVPTVQKPVREQTDDEIAARKEQLRAQAKALLLDKPEGSA